MIRSRLNYSFQHHDALFVFGMEAAVVGASLIACFAETLMDSRWATTELAWTTYPESGVSVVEFSCL